MKYLEEPPDGETPHWTCLLRLLSSISGFMKARTKPGDRHESWVPFYGRDLSYGLQTRALGSMGVIADHRRNRRAGQHP